MGRFDDVFKDYYDVAKEPAAPQGLRQAARAGQDAASGNRFAGVFGDYVQDRGYVGTAQSWYTGANQEGVQNGWQTDFVEKFMEGQEKAAEQGTLATYFEEPDATGVVLYDHQSLDGRHDFTFGDVYVDGKKVSNVYDEFKDRNAANLLMSQYTLDADTLTHAFADGAGLKPDGTPVFNEVLDDRIKEAREQNNEDHASDVSKMKFQGEVDAREKAYQESGVPEKITIGGILGGIATGAGAGAVVGNLPGAIVGGIAGGIAGGLGAGLNQDALTEQAARAAEITELSYEKHSDLAGFATGVQQWAGFGGKLVAPLSNLTQGVVDWQKGDIGDGTSEFYAVDKEGDRKVGRWLQVADVAATVGDMALQFSNPLGKALYTTQMSGVIAGETAELISTGGESFDYKKGTFDQTFTDDDGDFSLTQGMAGIGKIGIDVVQLGMVHGLAAKADAARFETGMTGRGYATLSGDAVRGVLPSRLGGYTAEQQAALRAGGTTEQYAGMKFVKDQSDQLVGKARPTLSLLAPSEQLSSVSARVLGLRTVATEKGALSADDFYAASKAMATGERKWTTSLVNAMGEGYEEAAQAVFENYSHDGGFSASEIATSAVYGFAGGLGMGLGISTRMPGMEQKLKAQAQLSYKMMSGGAELPDAMYEAMSPTEQRALAAMSKGQKATAEAAFGVVKDEQETRYEADVAGVHKFSDAIRAAFTKDLITRRTDGAFVATGLDDGGRTDADGNVLPGTTPGDAVTASGRQTAINLVNHLKGVQVQLEQLERDQATIEQQIAALATDDPQLGPLQEDLADAVSQTEKTRRVLELGPAVVDEATQRVSRMYDPAATRASIEAEALAFNAWISDLYRMKLDTAGGQALSDADKMALSRSVTMLFARDPHDHGGSYQMLMPQVSYLLTLGDSDDMVQIGHGILSGLAADFDGDKLRPLNQLIVDDEDFTSLRSGANLLGAGSSVNITVPEYEPKQMQFLSKALASQNTALRDLASGTLLKIATAIQQRYDGLTKPVVLDKVLDSYFEAARAGSKDARKVLLDGLADKMGGPISTFARGNMSNEWLWLDQLLRSSLDEFQESHAEHRVPPSTRNPSGSSSVLPHKRTVLTRKQRQADAAVPGISLSQQTAGDTMFRKFQKLHYSAYTAAVRSAEHAGERLELWEQVQLYESWGQGLTRAEIDAVRAKDEITARTFATIQKLAVNAQQMDKRLNRVEAMVLVANMAVTDLRVDSKGNVTGGKKPITLAQMLLRQNVERDRREKDAIFEGSPELKAKHARLLAMTRPPTQGQEGSQQVNAEKAFVEVFGAQSMYTLLGEDAARFGPHLTLEQAVRDYSSKNEIDRKATTQQLKSDDHYLGRKKTHNIPYTLDEARNGQVSPFRSVVDSILGAGNARQGELAKKSNDTSKTLQQMFTDVRAAVAEIAGRKTRKPSADLVEELFRTRPDFAAWVWALIPNQMANAVLTNRDGTVYAQAWVYEMFAAASPAEAEMILYRNMLLSGINARAANQWIEEDEDEPQLKTLSYGQLKRQMERVIYALHPSNQQDGGILLKKFLDKLQESKSTTEFIEWVNTTPGIRGHLPPLTAWADDAAEYDADKAGGGWAANLDGAAFREAVGVLGRGTSFMVKDLVEETRAKNDDIETLTAIDRVVRYERGDRSVTVTFDERNLFDRFVNSLKDSRKHHIGLGPQAMIYQSLNAAWGFYEQAHTKIKNPPHLDPAGALEVMRDAFGSVTNYERVMAAMTAVDLEAVSSNPSQAMRDAVRTMDDAGHEVVWNAAFDDATGEPSIDTVAKMLELFKNADTRAAARSMMFPQVLERNPDGSTRSQMLIGKGLNELLRGTAHADLFPPGDSDSLSMDSALRYLSLVEARAREFGGSFVVQRAINDIVIAKLSAADHVLTFAELERLVVKEYRNAARVLQATAAKAASIQAPGADPFVQIIKDMKAGQRIAMQTRRAGGTGIEGAADAEAFSDLVFTQLVQSREQEIVEEKTRLRTLVADITDPRQAQVYIDQVARLDEQLAEFTELVDMLKADDMTAEVVNMFSLPADPTGAAHIKEKLVRYVLDHLSIMERASSAGDLLDNLTTQIMDHGQAGQIDLTDAEWDQLSRTVIAVYLDGLVSTTAPNVSVSPYPDADHPLDHRYYDTTFAYTAMPFMEGPMLFAAQQIHLRADRYGEVVDDPALHRLLSDTLFADYEFGDWTDDIPRASISANSRLDSASGPLAVTLPGQAPKTQAVISAATERTFRIPPDELLSTVSLDRMDLNKGPFDEVTLLMPGAVAVTRPFTQLNNRFAKRVTLSFRDAAGDPQQVELLTGPDANSNLGRVFSADPVARASNLLEIHMDRVRDAVDLHMDSLGLPRAGARVEIEFFHPDSQPVEEDPTKPTWYNNLFFEGTSFRLDADVHRSLNETLWFGHGSISPAASAAAMQASKLGRPAMQVVPTPSSGRVLEAEENWATDLAKVLREKTELMLGAELGQGKLDPEFYNAIYKDLKLRHYVRGMDPDGNVLVWSAEQAIAWQQANIGAPLTDVLGPDAGLWVPPAKVLRSLLGEQGDQGVDQLFDEQLEFDLNRVNLYQGVSPMMLTRFGAGLDGTTVDLEDTEFVNRARQSQLVVRAQMDEATRVKFDLRTVFFSELETAAVEDRPGIKGLDPRTLLARVVQEADEVIRAENIAFDWADVIPFVGPRSAGPNIASRMLLHELEAALELNEYRMGWIYENGGKTNALEGLISEVGLGKKKRPGMMVAPGDLVLVKLDSFKGKSAMKDAKKALDYLAGRGAYIVLGNATGRGNERVELSAYLRENGYGRIAGSGHLYQPNTRDKRYQNQHARASSLLAMEGVSPRNHLAIFNVEGKSIEEGTALVNHDNPRLHMVRTAVDLVKTNFLAAFNVPEPSAFSENQVTKTQRHLQGMNNPEGRQHLRDMANGHLEGDERAAADKDLDDAFTRLLARFTDDYNVLPKEDEELVKGDIIPLTDNFGRLLLYRHGMRAPKDWQVKEMAGLTIGDDIHAANVAIFPTKSEKAATVHEGRVVRFNPRATHGLQVELDIDLKVYGEKYQVEWNGQKYVLAPRDPSVTVTPDFGFFDNWGIDIISDLPLMYSKEAKDGVADNFRNAFAYFGIDFRDDLAKFFGTTPAKAVEIMNILATEGPPLQVGTAHQLINSRSIISAYRDQLTDIAMRFSGDVDVDWVDRLENLDTVEAQIAGAMIIYLAVPGTKLTDVLRSGGFNDESTDLAAQSQFMPRLFTQAFDNSDLDGNLRNEMFNRFNAQFTPMAADGSGYVLHNNWVFEVRNADPKKNMRGKLQFSEVHSSGDSPVLNGMSFDDSVTTLASQHSQAMAFQAIGAQTPLTSDLTKSRGFAESRDIARFDPKDNEDGGVWRMLTNITPDDKSAGAVWRASTPGETLRRQRAAELLVQYRQKIAQKKEYGWSEDQIRQYNNLAEEIMVGTLNLQSNQKGLLDFWVRQVLGQPAGADGTEFVQHISGDGAIQAAEDIRWAVQRGYMPTISAMVPLTHAQDLQLIYRANKGKPRGWKPVMTMEKGSDTATEWDDWVSISIGSVFTSENLFDRLYLLALDGFLHTYQNATRALFDVPVSTDVLVALKLIDPDTSRMIASIEQNTDLIAAEPMILDVQKATLDEAIGGNRIAGKVEGQAAPSAAVAKRRKAIREWRAKKDVAVPVENSLKDLRRNGQGIVTRGTSANGLMRGLINLRVGTAMLNPQLYMSMGPEQWIRATLDNAANLITGQATHGLAGRALAKAGLNRYTPEQLKNLNILAENLGHNNDFKALVYRDLMHLRPNQPGIGRIAKWLEGYAKLGAKMQDPTWGMAAKPLGRRYLEAALQHILATPTLHVLSTDRLIAEMSTNPRFLKDNFPDAHLFASNAIAQIRSLKQTPLSLMLRGIYEPLSEADNWGINLFGNLVLKMPLIFSNYSMNVLTTITGMQGLSDFVAMGLHGRDKGLFGNTMFGRIQAKIRGEEFSPERDGQFDMSSVMEGIDLTRSFVRGGLTHTGLFAFGLMAGGLGLSGEDDETKRRRKLSEMQGVPFAQDPRQLIEDFRNADSIFLDWLPFGFENWFKVGEDENGNPKYMGQLHWMLKQFISPIIGMEKFFETGDFRHVTWGFQDALGAFPLINTFSWDDAVNSAAELAQMADEQQKLGGPQNLIASANFLTNAVGVYEKMLFENAFVNMLYTSFDRYDRDPYKLPLRDSDGDLQKDIEGNVRPNDLALQSYVDPETGEVLEGYLNRDPGSAVVHALTENRASLAFAMSIFTGLWDSDYYRRNMPKKQRVITKQPVSREEIEAFVLAEFTKRKGRVAIPKLDADELAQIWIEESKKPGGPWVDWGELGDVAYRAAQAGAGPTGVPAALSLMQDAREQITEAGARGVFNGLHKGTIKLGDPMLRGIGVSYEMRQTIARDWSKELVQEGLNMGLDRAKANSRMNRIMQGDFGTNQVGLGDLLFAKPSDGGLSYDEKVTYNQLNTTYVMGPDGRPWATGFKRDGLLGALGLKPFKSAYVSQTPETTGTDQRLNTTDFINSLNTGLRALELDDETRLVPTDVEIGKSIEEAIKEAAKAPMTPFAPYAKTASNGYGSYGGYGGYGGGGYGGGGGGGYSPNIYYTRMYALPGGTSPYGNSIPFINTTNPLIRRESVRRERVWSERGRLKQWQ